MREQALIWKHRDAQVTTRTASGADNPAITVILHCSAKQYASDKPDLFLPRTDQAVARPGKAVCVRATRAAPSAGKRLLSTAFNTSGLL